MPLRWDEPPFGGEFLPIEGETSLVEGTADLPLRVSAGSFFQVNPAVGTAIHDAVAEAAAGAPPGPALDLYGGVGATAVRLARAGRPVRLVEAPGPAIEDARANLAAYPGAHVEAAAMAAGRLGAGCARRHSRRSSDRNSTVMPAHLCQL